MPGFLKNISSTELVILAVILITLFGSRAFISLGKTAGESVKELKKIRKNIFEPVEEHKPKKKEVSN